MARSEQVACPNHELMLDHADDPELSDAFVGARPSPDEARQCPDMGALEIGGDAAPGPGPKTKTWQARQAARQQQKQQRVVRGYGSTEPTKWAQARKSNFPKFQLPWAATGAYNMLQQAFVCLAAMWFFWSVGQRLLQFVSLHGAPALGAAAPSPSPGTGLGRPCSGYTYPQCEDAIKWYMQQGVKDRCQAFERVKAEGDMVMFPYTTSREVCPAEGCCGCAGQCSRCPPLLAECSFWKLDGIWRVAFEDGSEAIYTFDPQGHVQARLPESLLPPVFKTYDNAFLPEDDLKLSRWVTEAEGEKFCVETKGCQSVSFDLTKRTDQGHYYAKFSTGTSMVTLPGKRWRTLVRQAMPPTPGGITAAGPLKAGEGAATDTYIFDLHKASPNFFGEDAAETFTLKGGELEVERRLHRGQTIIKGNGVIDRDLMS